MSSVVPALRVLGSALAGTAGILLVASLLVFAMVRSAPGDPVEVELAASGAAAYLTPAELAEAKAERRAELGLDGTALEQYAAWMPAVVRLDLGTSFQSGRPVTTELAERLPASLALAALAFALSVLMVLVVAVASARRPGSATDHALRLSTIAVAAVPSFLLGSFALREAATHLGYPIAGPVTAERIWLPALVLAVSGVPTLARVLRAALIAEGGQPYAEAARARGTSRIRVLTGHLLRPAGAPVLTLAGLQLSGLVAGSVITEVVFSWPGVAAYSVTAIEAQDYPVIQAYVLLMVVVVVVVNRTVDLLQRWLDPRVDHRAEVLA